MHTFDIDVFDHYVPILFGLELQKWFQSSSNEEGNTFANHLMLTKFH